jgi:hypothetical protein
VEDVMTLEEDQQHKDFKQVFSEEFPGPSGKISRGFGIEV